MVNLVDKLREISVNDILKTPSINQKWSNWKSIMRKRVSNTPKASSILDLGDELASVFKNKSQSGRSQGSLKSGGVAWECLVAWYLNLCMIGSRTVVVKMKKELVPEPIRDAITVMYGSFASNSESDLLAITFPKRSEYNKDIDKKQQTRKGIKELMDALADPHFAEYEVGIIQCKTNWNDNAQIPMLWDMVYHSKGFGARNITVGKNNFDINSLKKFSYSFVTVPTVNTPFKKNSTPVNRVHNISGGNYWGLPSQSGICSSLKEIFSVNFTGGAVNSIRADLGAELPKLKTDYAYFDL